MKKYGLSTIFHHSCLNVKTKQEENMVYLMAQILLHSLYARAFCIQYEYLFFYIFFIWDRE